MKTARQLAFDALNKMERDKSYSNIVLDKLLTPEQYSPQERALASTLFYGVLERRMTLDYCIKQYSKQPFHKIEKEVRNILRLGFYQVMYLNSIDDYAAVSETVNLCLYAKKHRLKGFVNGILRNFLREDKQYSLPDKKRQGVPYYCVKYSCPEWLMEQWISDYGWAQAVEIVKAQIQQPPITIRVNTLRISAEELLARLQESGTEAILHKYMEDCIELSRSGAVRDLPEYQEGLFHVQDVSSQLCAQAAAHFACKRVYDMCAAPGGKTFSISERLGGQVPVYAFDLHHHRIRLIEEGAQRLGLPSVHAIQGDALKYQDTLEKADVVLVDAPCSGFGIIRRKPEIKYKEEASVSELPELQLDILRNCAKYVEEGGILLYSTCTLSKKENENVAVAFLEGNAEFVPHFIPEEIQAAGMVKENTMTFFPNDWNMDGFFLSVFKRIR